MPTFSSKPLGRKSVSSAWTLMSKLSPQVRKHPVLLFGVPFVMTIVGGSYGLSQLTQTRYDYNATKVQTLSKEEELGMRKDRRKIDLREEYYVRDGARGCAERTTLTLQASPLPPQRLQAKDSELEEWEPKRIVRPEGVPEWGIPPTGPGGNRLEAEERPPGMPDTLASSRATILGPDGKPCRACNSKLAFSAAMRSSKGSATAQEKDQVPSRLGGALGEPSSCPPDGDNIGQSTWTFLHSAAAYYPPQPSSTQQSSMLSLIQSLPNLYPCHSCADALQDELRREAREGKSWEGGKVLDDAVRSGPGLRKWLCGLHNEVNHRLGKPTWKCEETPLQTRWLHGPEDGSCD